MIEQFASKISNLNFSNNNNNNSSTNLNQGRSSSKNIGP